MQTKEINVKSDIEIIQEAYNLLDDAYNEWGAHSDDFKTLKSDTYERLVYQNLYSEFLILKEMNNQKNW